jgi:hypothetical protein
LFAGRLCALTEVELSQKALAGTVIDRKRFETMESLRKSLFDLLKRFIENDPWVVIPVMFVIFSGLFISLYLGSK